MLVAMSYCSQYVTVHAKTSPKFKFIFGPAYSSIATCTACLPWPDSIGLLFWGVDLQPCKTLAPVESTNWV